MKKNEPKTAAEQIADVSKLIEKHAEPVETAIAEAMGQAATETPMGLVSICELPGPAESLDPEAIDDHAGQSYDRYTEVEDILQNKISQAALSTGVEVSEWIQVLTDNGRGLNSADSVFIRLSSFSFCLKRILHDVQEEIADYTEWIEDFEIDTKGLIAEATFTDAKGAVKAKFSNQEMRDAEFLRFSKTNSRYQRDFHARRTLERVERRLKAVIEANERKHTDFRLIYGRETVVIANDPEGSPLTYELTSTATVDHEGGRDDEG